MVITDMNIRTGRMESEIKVDTDNETAAAIAEGRQIMRDRNEKGYRGIDELKAALEVCSYL